MTWLDDFEIVTSLQAVNLPKLMKNIYIYYIIPKTLP